MGTNIANILINTGKAAEFLGISTSTLYRMVEKGILTPVKTPGGQRRFDIVELEKYLDESKTIVAPQNPRMGREQSTRSVEDEPIDLIEIQDDEPEDNIEKALRVDPRNNLNDLTGKEWLPETKSFFFQKGLGSNHQHAQIERQHPAPYSFQDISRLVLFFTKHGQKILDPFGGVGSTVKACALNDRICTQIELSPHWHELAIKRLEMEVAEGESSRHQFINADCRKALKEFASEYFDFMVTSPPYWAILNKRADHKVKKERVSNNLATNYSDNIDDLGNIKSYEEFLGILVKEVFLECGRVLKEGKYMCLVVSDFRNKSEFISFHSDLIQKLNKEKIDDKNCLRLQGVKILAQNHKSLIPYGYPFAYVENIHHQYILIFRKEKV
jgi:excisionase family DNA binding protein